MKWISTTMLMIMLVMMMLMMQLKYSNYTEDAMISREHELQYLLFTFECIHLWVPVLFSGFESECSKPCMSSCLHVHVVKSDLKKPTAYIPYLDTVSRVLRQSLSSLQMSSHSTRFQNSLRIEIDVIFLWQPRALRPLERNRKDATSILLFRRADVERYCTLATSIT